MWARPDQAAPIAQQVTAATQQHVIHLQQLCQIQQPTPMHGFGGHIITVQNMQGVDIQTITFSQTYMGAASMRKRISAILQRHEESFVLASELRPLHHRRERGYENPRDCFSYYSIRCTRPTRPTRLI